MKNNESTKAAEDYLTNDQWVEDRKKSNQSLKYTEDKDWNLANDVVITIDNQQQHLTYSEKKSLGRRISKSINNQKYKEIIFRVSAAAAVLLVLWGIASIFAIRQESKITEFAKNSSPAIFNGDTRLILSGNKEIKIKSNESKIAYVSNSAEIMIDSAFVSQDVENEKVVYNTVIVPYGKRTHITLSDNSSVWLNSGSKLIYPACFAADKREVFLEGEAIFEVSHNKQKPFHVVTEDVEVKVLGTVFDLSAYSDDKTTSTILETGSVEIKNNHGSIFNTSKATMVPGTLAVYSKEENRITQCEVNVKLYTSWKDGYISCEKQSLGNILKKISRSLSDFI